MHLSSSFIRRLFFLERTLMPSASKIIVEELLSMTNSKSERVFSEFPNPDQKLLS